VTVFASGDGGAAVATLRCAVAINMALAKVL
jgi:hypothetical protein